MVVSVSVCVCVCVFSRNHLGVVCAGECLCVCVCVWVCCVLCVVCCVLCLAAKILSKFYDEDRLFFRVQWPRGLCEDVPAGDAKLVRECPVVFA